ncbi:hypothetical protein SAMN02910353_02248 [Ruminococcus sp. YRD2003]|nr:hypothetical protein SAMN02910353_02248 [Ruminococcus flavefaciens]
MPKDLTTSRLDRQNILNNEIAVEEMLKVYYGMKNCISHVK